MYTRPQHAYNKCLRLPGVFRYVSNRDVVKVEEHSHEEGVEVRQIGRRAGKRRLSADNDPRLVSSRLASPSRPKPPPREDCYEDDATLPRLLPPASPVIVLAKPEKNGRKTPEHSRSHSCVPSASGQKKHPQPRQQ